jgi:hypothetical protein
MLHVREACFLRPFNQIHANSDRAVHFLTCLAKQFVKPIHIILFFQGAILGVVYEVEVLEFDPASDFGLAIAMG